MDLIQTNIDCCGVNSSLDWNYNDIWKERAQEISDREYVFRTNRRKPGL